MKTFLKKLCFSQQIAFSVFNLYGKNTVEYSDNDGCFVIVHKSALSKFLSSLLCPYCFLKAVHFDLKTSKFSGFSAYGTVCCVECSNVWREGFLSNCVGGEEHCQNPFEVIILAKLAFRAVDSGYAMIKEWCGKMNFPRHLSENHIEKVT